MELTATVGLDRIDHRCPSFDTLRLSGLLSFSPRSAK